MTSVIYPGTFDPITNGHLDIIARSAVIFPKVFVAVANSPSKKPLFSLDERVELVRQSVAHLPNVEVFGFSDLLANEIKAKKITAIIRGVRTTTDFEYELQLAALNRLLTDGVDSLRSEERRVGKEGRCRRRGEHKRKKRYIEELYRKGYI